MSPAPSAGDPARGDRLRRVRFLAAALTVAATLPYLTLKVLWVAGSDLGITEGRLTSATYRTANAVTIVMDLAVSALAIKVARSDQPLLPRWVRSAALLGVGFLAPLPVLLVVAALLPPAQPTGGAQRDAGLEPWVFEVVYAGFVLQGILLAIGFVLHARATGSRPLTSLPAGRGPVLLRSAAAAASAVGAGVLTAVILRDGRESSTSTLVVIAAMSLLSAALLLAPGGTPPPLFLTATRWCVAAGSLCWGVWMLVAGTVAGGAGAMAGFGFAAAVLGAGSTLALLSKPALRASVRTSATPAR